MFKLKRTLMIPTMLLILIVLVSACKSGVTDTEGQPAAVNETNQAEKNNSAEDTAEKIVYQSENGPIEVPANPQRVAAISGMAGHVLALDVNLIGVDSWSKLNPRFAEWLEDVEEVSDESLEKLIELKPDLIIAFSNVNNLDKLNQIAPTVTYTYGNVDYLTQFLEIGKLLNKEAEAQAWIDQFKQRAQQAGEEIKAKIGEDTTVSVIELWDKQLYVYGNDWGRGTEILYQEMGLAMPEKVSEAALEPGYYALSLEVLPQFAGDYIILSKSPDADHALLETDTYRNIPAVQNGLVFEVNMYEFYYNDPLTLDYQLDFFIESFLGQ